MIANRAPSLCNRCKPAICGTRERSLSTLLRRDSSSTPTALYFTGGGNYYYWFAGAALYLKEYCDLHNVPIVGASAGSIAATLLKLNADFRSSTDESLAVAEQLNLYERKIGLAGIWGPLIRDWLHKQIPDTLSPQEISHLYLTITPINSAQAKLISNFSDKDDIINACMASIHIPLFLDGRLMTEYRGEVAIDGSFWHFVTRSVKRLPLPQYVQDEREVYWVDWRKDEVCRERTRKRKMAPAFQIMERQVIYEMMESGYEYMRQQDMKGELPWSSRNIAI